MKTKYNIVEAVIDTYERLKRLNKRGTRLWAIEITKKPVIRKRKRKLKK